MTTQSAAATGVLPARALFASLKKLTRAALVGLGAMIFLAPVVAAQSPVKAARIGVLATGTASTQAVRDEAFRQGLNELGYVEGRNIVIEYRYAEGKPERLPALAAELVRLNVDLILTTGDPGVRAAKQASQTIPIGDALLLTHRARIVDFATKNRFPAMYGNEDYMDADGLMFYGPNVADMFRRAATYVDKILKGAKPGDLPVEQPTKFELVINLKTAKTLGLTIPPSLLQRADQVIE